jgi:HSP20 family protein
MGNRSLVTESGERRFAFPVGLHTLGRAAPVEMCPWRRGVTERHILTVLRTGWPLESQIEPQILLISARGPEPYGAAFCRLLGAPFALLRRGGDAVPTASPSGLIIEEDSMAKSKNQEKGQPHNGGEHRRTRPMAPYGEGGPLGRSVVWPLARLRTEFDRLFEDVSRGWGGLPAWPKELQSKWDLDVEELEDKIIVRAEAPGFEPKDFDLQVRDDQLVLCACQSEETQQEGSRRWHQQELYQSIPLPAGVDAEHVDAEYRNGILTVTLPKRERSKGRQIEVKT